MRHPISAVVGGVLSLAPVVRAAVPVEQIDQPTDFGPTPTRYAPIEFGGEPEVTLGAGEQGGYFNYLTFHADGAVGTSNTLSDHSRFVGLAFYGYGSPAYPFVNDVYCQSSITFFDTVVAAQTDVGIGPIPGTFLGGSKVINNSYTDSNYFASQDLDTIRRIDYMIKTADVTFVAAAVTGTGDGYYNDLVWSSYNCLAVSGLNSPGSYFDPGRSQGKGHADVFSFGTASAGAAVVGSDATALYGTAQGAGQADGLHGFVIRSLLMTGADKTASNGQYIYSRDTASGLSKAFGAGQIDYPVSLTILQAGEKSVAAVDGGGAIAPSATATTTQYGWAESTSLVNGRQALLIHADNAITGVTASLNWDVTSAANISTGKIDTSSPIFANLALELRTVTGSPGSYVLGPPQADPNLKAASTVDNVEYLYSTAALPAGNYALVVTGDPSLATPFGLSYALAGTFDSRWNLSTGGSWGAAGNWSGTVPDGPAARADLLASPGITTPSVVTLDAGRTIGQIVFNNTNAYTIAAGTAGTLTIDDSGDPNGPANPVITVLAGAHAIAAPVTLAGGLTVNTSAGASVTFGGNVGGAGGVAKIGAGTLTLSPTGSITSGTITVIQGTLNFAAGNAPLQRNVGPSIDVASGATVTLSPPQSPGVRQVLITTGGLTLDSAATLDLTGNDLVVPGGNLATITAWVTTGFNAGGAAWAGTGITSSTAAADTTQSMALGVLADTAGSFNAANPFDGYAPATTDVLVKYTYFGDANLDGRVDGSDYALIDNGYLAGVTGWSNGDFNYDGTIDGSDYSLIDNAFNRQSISLTATTLVAAVPEPTMLGILVLGVIGRRRRA